MISKVSIDNYKMIASMAKKLWPDAKIEELEDSFFGILNSDFEVCLVLFQREVAIGFVHVSTRNDYVEGCDSSPVAYIEGIFIEENFRRQGYSKMLIESAEKWARSKGFKELASDCELSNVESIKFHLGTQFEEANRIVCFKKVL